MIERKAAREPYNDVIIDDSIWIRRKFNLADAMTKPTILPELVELDDTGKLHYEVEQSMKRTTTPVEQGKSTEWANKEISTKK